MRILCVLALLCGLATSAEPELRHVLALVVGKGPEAETEDIVHQLLEMPLNHLGIVVRRHYIGRGPPPDAWLKDARAVLTYFTGEHEPVAWLWPWLKRVKVRVIHFGDFGPLDGPELSPWLRRFGLAYDDGFVADPVMIKVDLHAGNDCTFEADPRFLATHRGPRNRSKNNRAWITTATIGNPKDKRTPVVTGPWGGIALDPWTLRQGTEAQDRRWHLNPFRFFREALGLERVPAPHPSVLNGSRMFFMQVDGDGFESRSTVHPASSARVFFDEVIKRHELPYTVSIIVRSLTPDYAVKRPTPPMRLASEILNHPRVEPASHGVLHTLRWQAQPGSDNPHRPMWYRQLHHYDYSPVAEVRDSIRFINDRLLTDGRRCRVMLWTGDACPFEGPILESVEAGCLNVNGGVFRWDAWSDSVGFVSPWSRAVGKALQVYAGAANENDFKGFFSTAPGAFAHVNETVRRTGHVRILKPANLYVHFYSAENPARLAALQGLIRRWAKAEPTAPVFASTYAKAVRDAVRGARILRTAGGWALRDFGECRTVRIDDEQRSIDWTHSRGLLGARRIGRSLYVHLAQPDADLVFGDGVRPHVHHANCLLQGGLTDLGVTVTATAHNPRSVTFAGLAPRAEVTIVLDGKAVRRKTDDAGHVTVELADAGTTTIELR